MIAHSAMRQRRLAAALREGAYDELADGALRAFTVAGVVLGVLAVVLIVAAA